MKLPVYNIVLGNAEGIQKMSLVEMPAVESDFIAFEKEQPMKFSIDEDKHIVLGVALRADFPIYRYDSRLGEYYVNFSSEVIDQLYQKFLIDGHFADVNVDHSKDVGGVYLIQSFIKNTETGINPVGFDDIANGSWFCAYRVDNADVWNEVKEGKFKGFSCEGMFELQPQEETLDDLIDEMLKDLN